MALWGNNDNLNANGTVTLDYATLVLLERPPLLVQLVLDTLENSSMISSDFGH